MTTTDPRDPRAGAPAQPSDRRIQEPSDRRIQESVLAELEWGGIVDAARVGVAVHDGVVTLHGELASTADGLAARHAALRVSGVKAVADDLQVRDPLDAQQPAD